MNKLHDIPGTHYTFCEWPVVASSGNTAYMGTVSCPFASGSGIVVSVDHIPVEAITGDNTNSFHINVKIVSGAAEIANLDYDTGTNGVLGVPNAFTLSGTTAQKTVAAGGVLLVEREEVGTQPALIHGHKIRVGWRGV